jgi:hypothetical protein
VTDSKKPEDFEDAELKHLEFIQGIIARLAQNSFLLKGWSVTLVAGILALASRNPSYYLVVVAIFPALVFWGLDAFYLGQERNLRDLYNDTREGKINVLDIAPDEYETGWLGWIKSLFGRSVWPIHVAVVISVAIAGWIVGHSA